MLAANKIACAVLCGGESRRFDGGNKLLADCGGMALLARTVLAVKAQASPVILVSNAAEHYKQFGLPIIPDQPRANLGPLAAINAALLWAKANEFDRILICAGDTPALPENWAEQLARTPAKYIGIPRADKRLHPACGLWPVSAAPKIGNFLRADGRSLHGFLDEAPHSSIDFTSGQETGLPPFFNINRDEDLKIAARAFLAL